MIPEKIKIGGVVFEVVSNSQNDIKMVKDNLDGHVNYSVQKIEIVSHLPSDYKNVVLLHESLHAILDQLGYDELNKNEQFISGLSNAFYQVLKDNKLSFGD